MLASSRMLLKSLMTRDNTTKSQFVSTSILATTIAAVITYHLRILPAAAPQHLLNLQALHTVLQACWLSICSPEFIAHYLARLQLLPLARMSINWFLSLRLGRVSEHLVTWLMRQAQSMAVSIHMGAVPCHAFLPFQTAMNPATSVAPQSLDLGPFLFNGNTPHTRD